MGDGLSKTKNRILKMLVDHQNEYLSGQKICDCLGCSRTAVWKHIKDLQKEGFKIDSVQKKGYRMTAPSHHLSEANILSSLKTKKLGHNLKFHETLPSTQKEAHHLAEDGAADGTLVVADEQSTGRGRLGREWHSPMGTGIWMSLIIRPDIALHQTPQLTLLTSVAVVKAIHDITGVECGIKWPNDILYNGKKIVGILTELQAEASHVKAIIIGIGMNVNADAADFPDELKKRAASIKSLTGREHDRPAIIQAILKHFELLYNTYLEEGFEIIKLLWESYALSLGKEIYARTVKGDTIKGLAKGIDDEGVLLLETRDGTVHHIYSADIEII
ncbi:BirA family biotin operon repressor/biotin-[acetyl-CoA-carboxylase] ligase [Scopulibacillus darangshiensis]|uniref:Bifunctional ligase/repressor BirA n=1 Tax=Scopulibacillus darangshiensis TaxID=442528 RepID=A0A4R2PCF8_9BACL|nr:biotin--[acetyl-CoA-carboxylase] ligase [Scopulibacillus darangshiensis]TCP31615.1 BirA family biotin operon repressor/biotin-[acetyl-CoA-carboxylase] ligase [Scopulibacillus darangshiensis]